MPTSLQPQLHWQHDFYFGNLTYAITPPPSRVKTHVELAGEWSILPQRRVLWLLLPHRPNRESMITCGYQALLSNVPRQIEYLNCFLSKCPKVMLYILGISFTLLQRQNAEKIEVSSYEIIILARRELLSSAAFQAPEISGHQSFVLQSIILSLLEFQVLLHSLYYNDQKFQALLKFNVRLPKPQYRSSQALFYCPRILRAFNSKHSRFAMILNVIYFDALDKLPGSIPFVLVKSRTFNANINVLLPPWENIPDFWSDRSA